MLFEALEPAQAGSDEFEAIDFLIWLVPVLLVVGIVSLVGAIKRRRRLAVFAGGVIPVRDLGSAGDTVVVEGAVVTDDPLISPITNTPCVYCTYSVEEEWRREWTVREQVPVYRDPRDPRGRGIDYSEVTHQKSEVGTKVIAKDSRSTPFQVRDATGEVLVIPERAEVTGQPGFEGVVDRSSPMFEVPGVREQPDSTGHRKLEEHLVPVGAQVTVVGPVETEGGTPRIRWEGRRRPSSRNPFVVTMQKAGDAARSDHRGMVRRFVVAGACLVGIVAVIAIAPPVDSEPGGDSGRDARSAAECVERFGDDPVRLERCLLR